MTDNRLPPDTTPKQAGEPRRYRLAEFAAAFGNGHVVASEADATNVPLECLATSAHELSCLAAATETDATTDEDLGAALLAMSRRMEAAAQIGHEAIRSLRQRVAELEAQQSSKGEL